MRGLDAMVNEPRMMRFLRLNFPMVLPLGRVGCHSHKRASETQQ
jgi:hypothetical protein